jgi:hypothetical protein
VSAHVTGGGCAPTKQTFTGWPPADASSQWCVSGQSAFVSQNFEQ